MIREFKNVKGADIIFRNFSGGPDVYSKGKDAGVYFHMKITDASVADELMRDGWNVKLMKKRHDDDPDEWHVKMNINFNSRVKPIVQSQTFGKNGLTRETPESIGDFDQVSIKYVNMECADWEYEPGKKSVYVNKMKIVANPSIFDDDENGDEGVPWE